MTQTKEELDNTKRLLNTLLVNLKAKSPEYISCNTLASTLSKCNPSYIYIYIYIDLNPNSGRCNTLSQSELMEFELKTENIGHLSQMMGSGPSYGIVTGRVGEGELGEVSPVISTRTNPATSSSSSRPPLSDVKSEYPMLNQYV